MRYEIKSVPLWTVTKVAFFVNLVVGLIGGIFLSIFIVPLATIFSTLSAYESGFVDVESGATGALVMMLPFLSALWSAFFGTLFVMIVVIVYNLTARLVGGVECRMEPVEVAPVDPRPLRSVPTESIPAFDKPPPPPPVTETKPPLPEQRPGGNESQDDETPTI